MNINVEMIKRIMKKGKKIVLSRILPFTLSTTALIGAMSVNVKASEMDSETIKAIEIYNSDNQKVTNGKQDLDVAFDETYSLLANGGLYVNNSVYRFLAEMTRIKDYLELNTRYYNYSDKIALENYYNEKVKEAKEIFSNMMGLTIDNINYLDKQYDCEYIDSLSTNNNESVLVKRMENNEVVSQEYYTYDNSRNTTDKALIIIPTVSSISSNGDINKTFTSSIVSRNDKNNFEAIKNVIDNTYENITNAISRSNYRINSKMSKESVMTSICGDTNLINSGITQKYASYTNVKEYIKQYFSFKQQEAIISVYKMNKNNVSYNEFRNYISNNYSLRQSEENGNVYYRVYPTNTSTNYSYYMLPDNGIIRTSILSNGYQFDSINTNIGKTSEKITVKYGVNTRIDGKLFTTNDSKGNKVESFIYNGTTYSPARSLSNAYGSTIYPDLKNGKVVINQNGTDYLTRDGNGNLIRCISDSVITSDGKVNKNLVYKNLIVSQYADIIFNGQKVTLTDSNGNVVKALVINGVTYLPSRAFTDLYGCATTYDGVEHTANLSRYTYENVYQEPINNQSNNQINTEIPSGSTVIGQEVISEHTEPGSWYQNPYNGKTYYVDENGQEYEVQNIGDRPSKIR